MKNKKLYHKINHVKIGFMTGLILPILGFFIGFLAKGGDLSISTFWHIFTQNHELVSNSGLKGIYQDTRQSTLMFCLLANMLAFYFSFFLYKIDRFSRGLVSITLILAAISFLFIY
jgi:hypothetical protein